ncbi:uncharacterized protein FTOL_11934 [Fusarium torulosum]|uniref:Malonyl-CoA:ACP transacylase (MAT) domain-containing protein n=1 Tax=Fusarium torulosum TaxID=33205 RepID=A0AAE8MJN3_9HYPO|nr:uncharacterized protein FTOL_11934 [Fusarium torulosum]
MTQLRGSETGVFIGIAPSPASHNAGPDLEEFNGYCGTGHGNGTMSGRVSYFLGLHGPTMTVDTLNLVKPVAVDRNQTAGSPMVAMLFSGQGSQYIGQARLLAEHYSTFHDTLVEIAGHFHLEVPLLSIMWPTDDSEQTKELIKQTKYPQPVLFAIEVALFRLWESWGVEPSFLLGHSVRELAVAYIAGIMDFPDACHLAEARGRPMSGLSSSGVMASLEADVNETDSLIKTLNLESQVVVAAYNSPRQTTISGDPSIVEKIISVFNSSGRRSKILLVSHAFHSHHIDSIVEELRAVAETIKFRKPDKIIVSSMTGRIVQASEMQTATYWVEQARNAVRFHESIETLMMEKANIFIEIGPHPVLCALGANCSTNSSSLWLGSLSFQRNDIEVIQEAIAALHIHHVPINWDEVFEPCGNLKWVDLPTYAFQRRRFKSRYGDSTMVRNTGKEVVAHDLPKESRKSLYEVRWELAHTVDDTK